MRINKPIRIAFKDEDTFRVFIIRESKEIEINLVVRNFIDYLNNEDIFTSKVFERYIVNNKLNEYQDDYLKLVDFLKSVKLIID